MFRDRINRELKTLGWSKTVFQYHIERETGEIVPLPTICRFLNGSHDTTTKYLELYLRTLDLIWMP